MSKQITSDQRSDEWFTARLGRATASHAADIMATIRSGEAATYRNYRAKLVAERLTGQKLETYTSMEMQWGIDNEPVACLAYELQTENEVLNSGFWKHDNIMAGASPDGLVGEDGLIEIKCPNTATHLDSVLNDKIDYRYELQMDFQLWITGRKWCDFVSYDPRLPANINIFIKRYERDEKKIQAIHRTTSQFLQSVTDMVENLSKINK